MYQVESLSKSEYQILKLAAAGLSNNQIAAQLGKKRPTISSGISEIFSKLNIHSRAELPILLKTEKIEWAETRRDRQIRGYFRLATDGKQHTVAEVMAEAGCGKQTAQIFAKKMGWRHD